MGSLLDTYPFQFFPIYNPPAQLQAVCPRCHAPPSLPFAIHSLLISRWGSARSGSCHVWGLPQTAASIHAPAVCHYLLETLSNLNEDAVPAIELAFSSIFMSTHTNSPSPWMNKSLNITLCRSKLSFSCIGNKENKQWVWDWLLAYATAVLLFTQTLHAC